MDDNTLFTWKKKISPNEKEILSLLNKPYQQKEHKKFAIGLKRQISAESHF